MAYTATSRSGLCCSCGTACAESLSIPVSVCQTAAVWPPSFRCESGRACSRPTSARSNCRICSCRPRGKHSSSASSCPMPCRTSPAVRSRRTASPSSRYTPPRPAGSSLSLPSASASNPRRRVHRQLAARVCFCCPQTGPLPSSSCRISRTRPAPMPQTSPSSDPRTSPISCSSARCGDTCRSTGDSYPCISPAGMCFRPWGRCTGIAVRRRS